MQRPAVGGLLQLQSGRLAGDPGRAAQPVGHLHGFGSRGGQVPLGVGQRHRRPRGVRARSLQGGQRVEAGDEDDPMILHQKPPLPAQGGERQVPQRAVGHHVDRLPGLRQRARRQEDLAQSGGEGDVVRMAQEAVREIPDLGRGSRQLPQLEPPSPHGDQPQLVSGFEIEEPVAVPQGAQNAIDRLQGRHRRLAHRRQQRLQARQAFARGVGRPGLAGRRRFGGGGGDVQERVEEGPRLRPLHRGEARRGAARPGLQAEQRFERPPFLLQEPRFELVEGQAPAHLLENGDRSLVGRFGGAEIAPGLRDPPLLIRDLPAPLGGEVRARDRREILRGLRQAPAGLVHPGAIVEQGRRRLFARLQMLPRLLQVEGRPLDVAALEADLGQVQEDSAGEFGIVAGVQAQRLLEVVPGEPQPSLGRQDGAAVVEKAGPLAALLLRNQPVGRLQGLPRSS